MLPQGRAGLGFGALGRNSRTAEGELKATEEQGSPSNPDKLPFL